MTSTELSWQLRHGTAEALARRRKVAALALTAAGSMGVIALYQLGLIHHLPEPPLPGLDADRVDASAEAYSRFQTPDALLGLTSYSVTALLAGMGGPERAQRQPWIPLAMAGKVGFDVLQGLRLTWDQATRFGAFCSWCLLAAGASFAMAPLVVPEVRDALRRLSRYLPQGKS